MTAKTTSKPSLKIETPQQSDSSSQASLSKAFAPPPSAAVPVPVVEVVAPFRAQPRPIISSQRNPHERDLFNALRASPPSDDPPSTSSSLNSGLGGATASRLPHVDVSLSSSSSSNVRQSPVKLFDDSITVAAVAPVPAVISTVSPTPPKEETAVKAAPAASQIKRKPVNLFNDDEFNSFMSEIVDKVQSKSGKETIKDSHAAPKSVNLFDDSPPVSPKATQIPTTTVKTLPTSIFEDNLDDDDFLSSFASKAKPKPQQKPRATTLFDDDDDELDINDIFKSSKQPKAENKLIAKNWLFEDDDLEDKDLFGIKTIADPAKQQRLEEEQRRMEEQQREMEQDRKKEEKQREQEMKDRENEQKRELEKEGTRAEEAEAGAGAKRT